MKSIARRLTLIFTVLAAIYLVFYSTTDNLTADDLSGDPLFFPVLLIHGLGESAGEEAFGNLQTYLEGFFFKVDVLDFNDFSKHKIAKSFEKGDIKADLDTFAAILGNKIDQMKQDYKAAKINIIAHSYGGLIAHAYLLNYGADVDKKKGGYRDDINRIVYIQTPFYGSTAEDETLEALAEETDYGVFTENPKDTKNIVSAMKLGSEWIHKMDTELRKNNVYDGGPDVLALVSSDDEIVSELNSTLSGFTNKLYETNRFRIFSDYSHSANPMSTSTSKKDKGSLGYVDDITNENFVTIASFLDNGTRWQKAGKDDLPDSSFLMVRYDDAAGYKSITNKEVSLKFVKSAAPSATTTPKSVYNEDSRVFVFYDFTPGIYKLTIKNSKIEGVEQEFTYENEEQVSYLYEPAKNELFKGELKINSNLKGIYVLPELVISDRNSETMSVSLKGLGLDTNGFEIEFYLTGALNTNFDKGRPFVLYNNSGSSDGDWNGNGSRLEVQIRGWYNHVNDLVHSGKISLGAVVDKNRNGALDNDPDNDPGEWFEGKGQDKGNDWKLNKNRIRLRVLTNSDGFAVITLWHKRNDENERMIATHEWSKSYYNPDPVLSFGGRRHDLDYQAPIGAIITDFVVRNLKDK